MLITPETDPDHHTVGRCFAAWNGNYYYCDSYDSSIGYWMTNTENPDDRRNVSERAIGRSYHKIYFDEGSTFSRFGSLKDPERLGKYAKRDERPIKLVGAQ